MRYFKTLVFLVIIHLQYNIYAQDKNIFNPKLEDTLNYWGNKILDNTEDFVKYNANEHFMEILLKSIKQKNSIKYHYDSLKTSYCYTSPDKKFRLFNWTLPKKDGTFEYFGIIQSYNKISKEYDIYQLKDKSAEIIFPENTITGSEKWYGALYYKAIYKKWKGNKYYTFLAWDGNNNVSQKKIIEVLTFDKKGKPIFGLPIFKFENKIYKRIIFEYKANSTLTLRYEKQYVKKGKDKRWLIIYDRLIPEELNLKGFYQFYIPDKTTMDAFYFSKGKWVQVKNIDVRGKKKHFVQKRIDF